MAKKTRKEAAEAIWLLYFNQTLFEKGLITEAVRNRMKLRIEVRKPSISGRQAK